MTWILHSAGKGMKGAGRPHISFLLRKTTIFLSMLIFLLISPLPAGAQSGNMRIFSPQLTDRDRNSGGAQNRTIKSSGVKLSKTSYIYDGHSKKPSVTVRCGGRTLKKNRDFTVTYKNNKKPGTASVIVRGKGKYKGTVTRSFKIKKAKKR